MKYQTKLAALLLSSASALSIAHAQSVQVASASAQPSSEEIVRVTADDENGRHERGLSHEQCRHDRRAGCQYTLGSGWIVPEDGPKGRSTVTHQGIENLLPSANPVRMSFQFCRASISSRTTRSACPVARSATAGLVAAQMGCTVDEHTVNNSGNFADSSRRDALQTLKISNRFG